MDHKGVLRREEMAEEMESWVFFFFFLVGLGCELSFMLAKKVLYNLSQTSGPFLL
jgi:hypothetical protein